jgi:DNA-binding response OmpR family regulator
VTKGARVLIVEDEPALVRGLTDTFRAHGFDVLTARDGETGLDAALSQRPDLILLDIMLPRMNTSTRFGTSAIASSLERLRKTLLISGS